MANVQSYDYPGWGDYASKKFHCAQAVRIGDRILCSGQGGWDLPPAIATTANISRVSFDPNQYIKKKLLEEIDQAFLNCDTNLRNAGGKGWSQVYKIVTYSIHMPSQIDRIVYNMRKWMPDHRPLWTSLVVYELGLRNMRFQIDVEALDA